MRFISAISGILFLASTVTIKAQICTDAFAGNSSLSGVSGASAWTNPEGVRNAPDGNVVSIVPFTPLDPGDSSSRVGAWDFGFDIPCNAMVTSVTFDLIRRNNAATGDVRDETFFLRFPDFSLSPVNGANTSSSWSNQTTGFETVTYAPGDWGITLTPEIINDPLFGAIFTVQNMSATAEGRPEIDAISMQVCYTVNGTAYATIETTINETVDDLCPGGGIGVITINATGGSGTYEYSIDGGQTWQLSNTFPGLQTGNYDVAVRNDDSSCTSILGNYYVGCNEGNLLQVGDAIYTCQPTIFDQTTLAIDRIQPLNDFYNQGLFFMDVSPLIQKKSSSWTTTDLGGPVFGVAIDEAYNIYTGVTSLFEIVTPVNSADLIKIDAVTGTPTILATLPGNAGIAQVEYVSTCDQVMAANLEDGTIYRYDGTGNLLSTFDPLLPDDGGSGLAPLGERVLALSYNTREMRLYYSIWANDRIDNGNRNQIRSVSLDPSTCDFVPGSDRLEINMPFLSGTESTTRDFSHPVLDIEFDQNEQAMLIGESGFDSTIPISFSHQSRVLLFEGSTGGWVLNNTVPTGNQDYRFQIGTQNDGTNSLGGVDFAYADIGSSGCTNGKGTFIASIADALTGVDCALGGCLYGVQYMPIEGANPTNSVLLDLARAPDSQQKGFYGDIDIVSGCCPCSCISFDGEVTASEEELCPGDITTLCVSTDNPTPSYLWSEGSTTACIDVSPLASSAYQVSVSGSGCTDVFSIDVAVANALTVAVSSQDGTSCDMDNGSITITTTGGIPPFEYSIDGGLNVQGSGQFDNLMAGSYMIQVTDDFGCLYSATETIEGPGTLSLVIIADDQTNCDFPNGIISIAASGGTEPYAYSINGGATFSSSDNFVDLTGGMYTITVEDAQGCAMMEVVQLDMPACFGTIGDLVFEDSNGNGARDFNEPGIADVTVDLINRNGVIISRTMTDDNGNYLFERVPEGDYYIEFSYPDIYELTDAFNTANTESDSDVDNSNGPNTTPIFSLSANEINLSIDLGLYECVSVGELVWYDFNENDIFDQGESGINGVKVEIFRIVNGDFFLEDFAFTSNHPETVSDDGYYKFCVPPGVYYIKYDAVASAFVRAVPNIGFNEAVDSDVTDRFGRNTTDQFTLTSGMDMCEIDAGFYLEGTIASFCWHDDNLDGLRDDEELPMEGLTVLALTEEGNVISSSVSDANGQYRLSGLPKDHYYLEAMFSRDYTATLPNAGEDDSRDSDLDGTFGNNTTRLYMVNPGDVIEGVDIGVALSPLPVEWLSIEAKAAAGYNSIVWQVASETNVLKYEVEHSTKNTFDFNPIGEVASLYTNSQEVLTYNWDHADYQNGVNYYRIKQIDIDGRYSYSEVAAVTNGDDDRPESLLSVFPNPTNGWLYLSLTSEIIQDTYEVKVLDYLGRIIKKETVSSSDMTNAYRMDMSSYNEGLYSVQVTVGGVDLTKRVFLTN